MSNQVYFGNSLNTLRALDDEAVQLVYCEPPDRPSEIGKPRRASQSGWLTFGEMQYRSRFEPELAYLAPRLVEMKRVLQQDGTLYFRTQALKSHMYKVFLLDPIFGRLGFINEVIWVNPPKESLTVERRWPASHEVILVYVKDPKNYYFDLDAVERIPYMAPGLVGPKKRQRGKLPTDTWWRTQLTSSAVEMVVRASTPPGACVLDPFARQGVTGEICQTLGRKFILIEDDPDNLRTMARKFKNHPVQWHNFDPSEPLGAGS